MPSIACMLIGVVFCLLPSSVQAQTASDSSRHKVDATTQLRSEVEAMKQQMQLMQEKIDQQDTLIKKLSAQPTTLPSAPAVSAGDEERLRQKVTEKVLDDIRPSLAAANKTFPSQFNPAIGLTIDAAGSYKDNKRGNFEFRSAELGLSANIDPFTRGYALLTGTPDGFEVDEAAIVTTELPYNLAVKGGRFFADFGRLSHFHDHQLPFVNRPVVLDRFVGGEGQADGIEVSYLAPLRQYLTLTAGIYNKLGAENKRVDTVVPRDLSQFTYLWRAASFLNLTDANSVDLGASYAYTPKVKIDEGSNRHLVGVDLTYRYTPLSQAGYRGLVWGTEFLYNRENRPVGGFPEEETDEPLDFQRRNAFGLYSYLEARLTRRFYLGFLFDYAQNLDRATGPTFAYAPYFTIWASDFQRIRLQYTRLEEPGNHENQFFLQWSVALGSHVHGFTDR